MDFTDRPILTQDEDQMLLKEIKEELFSKRSKKSASQRYRLLSLVLMCITSAIDKESEEYHAVNFLLAFASDDCKDSEMFPAPAMSSVAK